MFEPFDASVSELESRGVLLVQDGNHGNDRPRPDEFVEEGMAFIRAADMQNGLIDFTSAGRITAVAVKRIRKGKGLAGDVLLSHKGTVGKVAIAPANSPRFVCSPQTTFWRSTDLDQLDNYFLKYYLTSPFFTSQLDARKGESDMAPYVSLTEQRKLVVRLPSIAEQRAIAGVLGALDDKIAANNTLIAVSEEFAILLAGQTKPTVAVGDLASHLKQSVDPLLMNVSCVAHFSLPAYDIDKLPALTRPREILSSKFVVAQPSVLISKLNPRFPRVWNVAELPMEPALASTEFLILDPLWCSTTVLWALLSQAEFAINLDGKAAGTSGSHQRVRPADLLATLVGDPREMTEALQSRITSVGLLALALRTENRSLAATRDALLPQLMSGKLRVKDAEKSLAGVL